MNTHLKRIVLTHGVRHFAPIDSTSDYLFEVPPDSAAEEALAGLLRLSGRSADVGIASGPLGPFGAHLLRTLAGCGIQAAGVPLVLPPLGHAFVLARAPSSTRILDAHLAYHPVLTETGIIPTRSAVANFPSSGLGRVAIPLPAGPHAPMPHPAFTHPAVLLRPVAPHPFAPHPGFHPAAHPAHHPIHLRH